VLLDDLDDRLRETVLRAPHDLDRERAWELEGGRLLSNGTLRGGSHGMTLLPRVKCAGR
jgi:hypothetical protein